MMRTLCVMAAEEDITITELLIEGINKVFAERQQHEQINETGKAKRK